MIREISREEIPECVQVIRRSHQTVADEFGFTPENAPRYVAFATDENRLAWQMYQEHRLMFLDEESGVICGFYSLLLKPDGECELGSLSVLPEYRHRGIGTGMLAHAMDRMTPFFVILREPFGDRRIHNSRFFDSDVMGPSHPLRVTWVGCSEWHKRGIK